MRTAIGLTAAVALAWPAAAAAQDLASAQRFVEGLYGAYRGDGPQYLGRQAPKVFSPRLLALIRRDQALAHGEVGALDGDPICDCQDWDIKAVRVAVTPAGAGRAKAVATFRNTGDPVTIRLDLVATGQGWRVDNIHAKDTPDLVAFLRKHAGGR
jgi:Protein of unknown function (DUF3828)